LDFGQVKALLLTEVLSFRGASRRNRPQILRLKALNDKAKSQQQEIHPSKVFAEGKNSDTFEGMSILTIA
jgi:hypothetical protein